MNKAIFEMLVGLPGSGKSTYANKKKDEFPDDVIICSSDAIREEVCNDVNCQDKNTDVFKILHERVKENLRAGKYVIYDATNISSKRRRAFLYEIKNIPCLKVCTVISVPYEQCLENNRQRERKVPEDVIKKMYMNWNTPYWFEGWDQIGMTPRKGALKAFHQECTKWDDFDQRNLHHSLSLGEHMDAAYDYIDQRCEFEDYPDVFAAVAIHDCGKPFTQVFHNSKGEPTEEAHYYQHQCVGAYDALFFEYTSCVNPLTVSVLINLHMHPYFWEHEKSKKKYKRLWGDKLFEQVMMLHEADLAAH